MDSGSTRVASHSAPGDAITGQFGDATGDAPAFEGATEAGAGLALEMPGLAEAMGLAIVDGAWETGAGGGLVGATVDVGAAVGCAIEVGTGFAGAVVGGGVEPHPVTIAAESTTTSARCRRMERPTVSSRPREPCPVAIDPP